MTYSPCQEHLKQVDRAIAKKSSAQNRYEKKRKSMTICEENGAIIVNF